MHESQLTNILTHRPPKGSDEDEEEEEEGKLNGVSPLSHCQDFPYQERTD